MLLWLYSTRFRLEYAFLVWYLYCMVHCNTLERIQRRFLKFLFFQIKQVHPEKHMNYMLLVDYFGFQSLLYKRILVTDKFVYNLVNGKIDCSDLLQMLTFRVPECFFSSVYHLLHLQKRTNLTLSPSVALICNNYNLYCREYDLFACSICKIEVFCSVTLVESLLVPLTLIN